MQAEWVRAEREQREHDLQVRAAARRLESAGHRIVATALGSARDIPLLEGELPGCDSDHCRTPDVYALDGGARPIIAEVETVSTIPWPRTRCQLTIFPRHGRALVFVPWAYRPLMRTKLAAWGIRGVEVLPY